MITLLVASQIAAIAGNAVGIIDKIYSQFAAVAAKKPTEQVVTPPSFVIVNDPAQGAIVSRYNNGQPFQTITYQELTKKLSEGDLRYVEILGKSLGNYQRQWESAHLDLSLASGMERGRLEGQLEVVGKRMAEPLSAILNFVETKVGMTLDDHYLAARDIAEKYSK
jgi:hypothetical protein